MGKLLYDVDLQANTVVAYDEKFYEEKHKDDFKQLLDCLLNLRRTTGANIKLIRRNKIGGIK